MLRKRTKRVLAPLLVLALLACHGAYGAAEHQLLFELAGAVEGHAAHVTPAATDGAGPHAWDADVASYAAAILVAVVGAVAWTRLRDVRGWRGLPLPRRSWALRAPPVLPPPRAPTPSSLQVYRL
ncbi:hypothetical protein GBA65_21175 (plasmid) [Rubrobacter marinus]|uniref:Uncharacterized protein n=1 Tax=Rubrobacter marinus TaxID=2653852 RepID=A0A6G8Q3E0_9ACTN|nr:hypothetical protein [Rubrobacter marinus]QIN80973.1 hypothetical protein GBA65_21175 [Rubrobacter marinus]